MIARQTAAATTLVPTTPTAATTTPASLDWGQLDQDTRELLEAALSANTKRTYRAQWQRWDTWCAEQGYASLPADPQHVLRYLRLRGEAGASLATIKTAAAAVAAVHRATGHPPPTAHPVMAAGMRALAKQLGAAQRQARGLSPADLVRIEVTAAQPRTGPTGRTERAAAASWRGRVDVALIRTLWDGLLRRSEAAALTWGDIEREEDGSGRLTVRRSKTDQEGEGATLYLSAATMDALAAIRTVDAAAADSVFSMHPDTVGRRVKAMCEAAGLGEGYSGHSGRIGTAQALVRAGAALPEVMQAGRWQGPAMVARYAAKELAGRGAVARLYECGKL